MKMKDMIPTTLILNAIRKNPSLIEAYVKSKILYVVEIDNIYYQYQTTFEKLVKNGRRSINMYEPREDESVVKLSLDSGWSEYVDVIWYKNKPLIFHKEHNDNSDQRCANVFTLLTFNIKSFRENLNDFINTMYRIGPFLEKRIKYKDINIVRGYDSESVQSRLIPLDEKTFDDVFIPDEQYNTLINGINNFIKSRGFLEAHHIPTHLGILLYGTPGCGRTSIIKSLIRKYNAASYYLPSLDNLPGTIKTFATRLNSQELTFIICEDVDATVFNRQKEYKNKSEDRNSHLKEVSLSEVLNSIDGICAPHNTIFIFTTNHIEELDPALIRPGRMDIRLEIKPICYETLNKFTKRFYSRELPKDYICKEGELFSNLQFQVMSGATFEDILNYMKGA